MLSLHPIFMFAVILLSVYALFLGAQRFLDKSRKGKPTFRWKRHVTLGMVTLFAWLAGAIFGFIMIYLTFKMVPPPGLHGRVGLVIGVLALFGLVTGYHMNRVKKRRKWLPHAHGLAGLIEVILALSQIASGWKFYVELTGGF